MGIPASRFIGMTWRELGRMLSPVESGQFSCLENSSAVSQFLLCSDQMINVLPKSTVLLMIRGVKAVSAAHSVAGLFPAKIQFIPAQL